MVELVDHQVLSCLLPYLSSRQIHGLLLTSKSLNKLIVDNEHFWEERYIRDFHACADLVRLGPSFRARRVGESAFAYFAARAGKFAVISEVPVDIFFTKDISSRITMRSLFLHLREDEWIIDLQCQNSSASLGSTTTPNTENDPSKIGSSHSNIAHTLIALTTQGRMLTKQILIAISDDVIFHEYDEEVNPVASEGPYVAIKLTINYIMAYRPGVITYRRTHARNQGYNSNYFGNFVQRLTYRGLEIIVSHANFQPFDIETGIKEDPVDGLLISFYADCWHKAHDLINGSLEMDLMNFVYPYKYPILSMSYQMQGNRILAVMVTQQHIIMVNMSKEKHLNFYIHDVDPIIKDAIKIAKSSSVVINHIDATLSPLGCYDKTLDKLKAPVKLQVVINDHIYNLHFKTEHDAWLWFLEPGISLDTTLASNVPISLSNLDKCCSLLYEPPLSDQSISRIKCCYEDERIPNFYGRETINKRYKIMINYYAVHLVEFSGHAIDTDKLYQVIEDIQATPEELERANPMDYCRDQLRFLYPQHDMFFIKVPNKFGPGYDIRSVIMH